MNIQHSCVLSEHLWTSAERQDREKVSDNGWMEVDMMIKLE